MDVNQPLALLAGMSPAQFMRRHWQKKPLLVRQAIPGFQPFLSRIALCKLAAEEQVESRLIVQQAKGWRMKQGPLAPRSLPPFTQKGWTLLVQGVDLHNAAAHSLLQQFRFVPDARLDDLMISLATPGGGVGPHFDSYDVFLFQASGRRRWKIGRQKDLTLQEGVPLKILQNFEPDEEFVLEAGDMLYLPPRYAHDGVAEASVGADGKSADCMTYSIGFRAADQAEMAAELLHRLAEMHEEQSEQPTTGARTKSARASLKYQDAGQPATPHPAELPAGLLDFANAAVQAALQDPFALACALGEHLTEPKQSVWFDESPGPWNANTPGTGILLDARTRMMYDANHIFINGESYRAKGADATLMRQLADQRVLAHASLRRASVAAKALLMDWHEAGWLQESETPD